MTEYMADESIKLWHKEQLTFVTGTASGRGTKVGTWDQKVIREKIQTRLQVYFTRREELEQIKQNVYCLLDLGGGCPGVRYTILCSFWYF